MGIGVDPQLESKGSLHFGGNADSIEDVDAIGDMTFTHFSLSHEFDNLPLRLEPGSARRHHRQRHSQSVPAIRLHLIGPSVCLKPRSDPHQTVAASRLVGGQPPKGRVSRLCIDSHGGEGEGRVEEAGEMLGGARLAAREGRQCTRRRWRGWNADGSVKERDEYINGEDADANADPCLVLDQLGRKQDAIACALHDEPIEKQTDEAALS